MIKGTGKNLVLPSGAHETTIDDMVARFVKGRPDEAHRTTLVKDLVDYLQLMTTLGFHITSVLVDGSFTTDKIGPSDIDCSPIIDGRRSNPTAEVRASATENWVTPADSYKKKPVPFLNRTVKLAVYGVVRIPHDHPNYDLGRQNELQRRRFWQMERGHDLSKKGYLEVRVND
ncbi:DUF6932 family protein [Arthrobacter alpinus]|uniref:DUF6932 family protein n=1 Tax=Arthrobacter alpinus TaxID=656366 RepID=UPI0016476705|nr:hypothetical protein [Arthrobacter alpinus]